ncbi:MAG: PEP-CTERM sorting domain-containing protein [Alphaproteobacteria bacterium]|nr:PEP-CTERM sorting domain-containing protein [Alphaproteobacteria bacterium]
MGILKITTIACAVGLGMSGAAQAVTITTTDDATTLVNTILGAGVTVVGTPTYTGNTTQSGTFTGGAAEVGFASGIVMSTGNANDIPGPNNNSIETRGVGNTFDDDINTSLGTAGAAEITNSFDASVLEFDFQFGDGSIGGEVNFAFVFASEEYIDFIDTSFNDEFQLLVDGVNLGTIGGSDVNINNINDVANSGSYINNVENTDGIPVAGLNIGFDGLTSVLIASSGLLGPGVHTAKFIIADVADGQLDAGVFIQAGTFNPDNPNDLPVPEIPVPAALPLFLSGLAGIRFLRRRRKQA